MYHVYLFLFLRVFSNSGHFSNCFGTIILHPQALYFLQRTFYFILMEKSHIKTHKTAFEFAKKKEVYPPFPAPVLILMFSSPSHRIISYQVTRHLSKCSPRRAAGKFALYFSARADFESKSDVSKASESSTTDADCYRHTSYEL